MEDLKIHHVLATLQQPFMLSNMNGCSLMEIDCTYNFTLKEAFRNPFNQNNLEIPLCINFHSHASEAKQISFPVASDLTVNVTGRA